MGYARFTLLKISEERLIEMAVITTNQTLQKRKLEILDKIDHLNYEHMKTNGSHCQNKNCMYCEQLRELGKQYEMIMFVERNNRDRSKFTVMRTEEILAKGKDVSRDEIKFLVEVEGISKTKLANLLGFPVNRFLRICKEWNIGYLKSV